MGRKEKKDVSEFSDKRVSFSALTLISSECKRSNIKMEAIKLIFIESITKTLFFGLTPLSIKAFTITFTFSSNYL